MKNCTPIYLGMDLGTSAFKAAAVDQDGKTVATAEVSVPNEDLGNGRVEIDALAYRECMYSCLRKLAPGADARAIALSGAGGSSLTMTGGNPSRIINWLDRRSVENPPACLKGLTSDEVRNVTGWPCVTSFPLAHFGWRKEQDEAALAQATWGGICTDYLLYCLSGKHALDESSGTTLLLIDQVHGCYHTPFLERIGLREDQLSPIVRPGTPVGRITAEAASQTGLPANLLVATGSFDHPSAARGCNVHQEGELLMSCGTSWVAFFPVASREWIVGHKLLCDPFESRQGGCYGAMFSIEALGRKIDTYVRKFIAPDSPEPYQVFNALAQEAGEIEDEIDLRLPCPDSAPLPPRTLARAVMNGAAGLFGRSLSALQSPRPFRKAVLAGGPAKSPVWPGIIQRRTGLEIQVTDSFTGARGAALLARQATITLQEQA